MSHYDELFELDRQAEAEISKEAILLELGHRITADNVDKVIFILDHFDTFLGMVEIFNSDRKFTR